MGLGTAYLIGELFDVFEDGKEVDYNKMIKSYSDDFPNNPEIQEILNKEIDKILKESTDIIKVNKINYIGLIVYSLKQTINEKGAINDFKTKLSKLEYLGFEGKLKKSFIDFYINWFTDNENPFYMDKKGFLKGKVLTFFDRRLLKFKKDNLGQEDIDNIINKLNIVFNKVKELSKQSKGPIKNQIGILYDVATNPKESLILYKQELQDQPWYQKELKKNGL